MVGSSSGAAVASGASVGCAGAAVGSAVGPHAANSEAKMTNTSSKENTARLDIFLSSYIECSKIVDSC
jgi:hypothetical protein